MKPQKTPENQPTFSISNLFIERLDKVGAEIETLGYQTNFGKLVREKPDLAFQCLALFLLALVTLPSEILAVYSINIIKGVILTTKDALAGQVDHKK